MTVEELDIIVQASVEQALTEFKKIVPQLKRTMKQVEDNLNNMRVSGMVEKVQQAVQQVKQKVNEVKSTGIDKELQKQFEKAGNGVQKYQGELEQVKEKLRQIYAEMDKIQADTWKQFTPEGVELGNKAVETPVNNALEGNKQFQGLSKEATKLEEKMESLISKLNNTKQEYNKISGQIQEVSAKQNLWSSAINKVKNAMSSLKSNAGNIKKYFSQIPNVATKINTKITQIVKGTRQGLGHILKYAVALLSLESIYGMLSSSANAWLSSQNEQAQQLNANIEYLRWGFGSALAPVIEFVTNLVYNLLKSIQSLVYALSGINIFANASAKAYSSMADSAKEANKATKQLAGVHNEINNISGNNSNSSGSAGGTIAPNIDLSHTDNQMSTFSQKLYDFFKPLADSWNDYGNTVIEAVKNAINGMIASISAMWKSIETIITNGTIYSIIGNILNSIGAIGQSWASAWKNDNNGTEIIQSFANTIDSITQAIMDLVTSTGFQDFLNGVLSAISGIVQVLEPIVSGFSEIAGIILEIVMSTIGDLLNTIGNALQTIAQNETASAVLKAIGGAIAIIVSAVVAWNVAQVILNGLMAIFAVLTSPITLIILGIVAAIAAIILIIQNWGAISEWFGNLWVSITNLIQKAWNSIKEFFINLWNGICEVAKIVWSAIATAISNVINRIKTTISNVLNTIKTVWNNIWNGIKNTVINIWNGIWSAIRAVINTILWGIESYVNGIIKGINWVLSGISKLANAVGSLIGLNPISLQLSTISLPRLAKGAVLTVPTVAEMAEYPGARNNPEIVTPQNIMEETFDRVLARYQSNSSNDGEGIKQLIIQFGSHKVAIEMESLIRQAHRRNGTASVVI